MVVILIIIVPHSSIPYLAKGKFRGIRLRLRVEGLGVPCCHATGAAKFRQPRNS